MLLCTWQFDLSRFALPSEAWHGLLLSELARASSSLRCAFQWLPSCVFVHAVPVGVEIFGLVR
jgi:hypothetical protein